MRKIRKGDTVVVIAGRDKGKRGDVSRVVDASHVVVNGINTAKRHTRPNPMKNQPGGIVQKELPIHVSNVAIWNPVTGKPDRVGFRVLEDGRKVRFFKGNGEQIGA
ncbi:MAG: 50S ribosomal protein L24 [Betaproteobacteria bacterium]|jgi:large subunit ribosomal protein L24|nr:50S ribosomal protein L24 [Betaproteobacteria bacterium]MDH5286764.1 50S ribosomal protein L24 [Betaproteobacteria bacterium]